MSRQAIHQVNNSMMSVESLLDFYDTTGTAAQLYKGAMDVCGNLMGGDFDRRMADKKKFPRKMWQELGSAGLLGVGAPTEYDGMGASFLAQVGVTAAISYYSPSVALSQLAHVDLCTGRIIKHANEEQKGRFLRGLINGTKVGALAMSEPGAGSDVMSMQTTATRTEGGYLLNGRKMWITNGMDADVVVVYAKTDPSIKGGKGITAFIVTPDMEGFSADCKEDKISMPYSDTTQLSFSNCLVPDENILRSVGQGGAILMDGLNTERVVLSAAAIELAQYSLDYTVKYVRERQQFGNPVGAFQANAFSLADAQAALDITRAATYYAAAMYERKKESLTNEISAEVFMKAGQVAEDVTGLCTKKLGGYGLTRDYPVAQRENDAKLYQIGGGTADVRKHIVGCKMLPEYAALFKAMIGWYAQQPA